MIKIKNKHNLFKGTLSFLPVTPAMDLSSSLILTTVEVSTSPDPEQSIMSTTLRSPLVVF